MDGSVMDESRDRGCTGKLMDKYNTISIDCSISLSVNNKGHNMSPLSNLKVQQLEVLKLQMSNLQFERVGKSALH